MAISPRELRSQSIGRKLSQKELSLLTQGTMLTYAQDKKDDSQDPS